MALFNRQKTQTISDLENYYANRNNSTGKAWLMALLSLLVTVAILAALFFGVRWIYRTLTNDETTVVTTTQTDETADTNISAVEPGQSTQSDSSTRPQPTTPPSEPNGVVSEQAASTTTPSTTMRTQGATSTPRTGDSLPNTGVSHTAMIAILVIVMASGYLFARNHYAKR